MLGAMELRSALLPPSDARLRELAELIGEGLDRLSNEAPHAVASDVSARAGIEISGRTSTAGPGP